MATDYEQLTQDMRRFAAEREWDKFHSPKNLAMALAGEAGELLECFQWLTEDESKQLSGAQYQAVAYEIADIQLYLLRLADKLNVDIVATCREKMIKNAEKYPADKVRGSSKKYTEYKD